MNVYYLYSRLIPLRCFYNNEIMEEEIMYSKSSILEDYFYTSSNRKYYYR